MEQDWQNTSKEIHKIVCDKFYGTTSTETEYVPQDRLHKYLDYAAQFKRIVKTQGVREAVYTTSNFLKRKLNYNRRRIKNSPVFPDDCDPLKWEKNVLSFPVHETPDVSIIIPVYNKWGYTYNCLKSILSTDSKCTYEIIIADDCSTDETSDLEKYVKGVIHVRNEHNLNFLKNCNHAAEYAKGRYVLFLNNDTLVMRDWLQSLYDLIESDATIGMVGSKFIYPDGTLQEAGGIVWSDGTGLNYGRGSDPNDAEYNFVRDVDYISGASIMLSRELWDKVGHFDERYTPAYFEDSDLAFKVREAGYRVVYQPRSELIHFERTSMSDNAFTLCAKNRIHFVEKWRDALASESYPPFVNEYIQRGRTKFRKSILYIDDKVPEFDQHAGGKTTFNFLQILVDLGFKVTFAGIFSFDKVEPYTSILQQMGVEVLYGQKFKSDFKGWLEKNAKYYDIAFLNRPECAIVYMDWFLKNSTCSIAYYGHDLHWLREQREYELTGEKSLLERSKKSKEVEMYIMSNSNIVMSVSPEEKTIIDRELGAERTHVTPIFFYREKAKCSFDSLNKDGILFVGGYNHNPNVDAVEWFMKDILPLVRKEIPDVKVTLAGSHPSAKIKALESEDVHVPGYLSDEELDALYDGSLVSIAPLRFGAGVKGKVVDAMNHGMAVVSTSIGLEGLPGIDNCITPYDDAESFAKEIVRLYKDRDAVRKAYTDNIDYTYRTFGYQAALDTFTNIFGSSEKTETCGDPVKILDISFYIDCPPTAGGSQRIISPLTKMKREDNVIVDFVFTTWDREYARKCENWLSSIPVIGDAKGLVIKDYLSKYGARPKDIPEKVWETMSKELSDFIDTQVRSKHYDIIQIEHTLLSWMIPRIREASPSSRIVIDVHNVEYRVFESWMPFETGKNQDDIKYKFETLKAWEERSIPWCDAAFTVSPIESSIVKELGVEKVYQVPTGGGMDIEKYCPADADAERPYDILYIGSMNWFPNYNGLKWFVKDVLPIIKSKRPGTSLHIVGNGTPDEGLISMIKNDKSIKFWGFQEDDASFFRSSKVFIVPLWIGAGARVKITTAWASKIPIVSTTFGAEGNDAKHGENIMLADEPESFADAVIEILDNPEKGKRIAEAGFATVCSNYTIEHCKDRLVSAYHEIAGK